MKIRNGFVSNSSSSSFVIIGRRLTGIMEVLSLTAEEQDKVTIIGNDGYDGTESCDLTYELLEAMMEYKPYEINSELEFWYAQATGDGAITEPIEIPAEIFSFEKDYYTSWDVPYRSDISISDAFHKFMKDRGYGDQRSEEEIRMEELLNEN